MDKVGTVLTFKGERMFELHISDNGVAQTYKISIFISHDGRKSLWISNVQGEGMEVSEKNFFDVIDKYFKEEF